VTAVQLDEAAWVLSLRTPTLPPATTTNTLIVAGERLAVIEPATPHAEEQRVLLDAIDRLAADGRTVAAILVTHHHPDHIGFAAALRERCGAPVMAHAETAARVQFEVDRLLGDGDTVDLGGGVELQAVFTPGHAPGHLVFLEPGSGIAHAGDMVAGEGTILIDPDHDGDMAVYLASLRRLGQIGATRLVPAHGPVLRDPCAVVEHYVRHRLAREAKVVAAIGPAGSTFDDVLARAYDDTPRYVWPLAAKSLEAHLRKLVDDGIVVRDGTRILLAPAA
jgi:glyoxylase-like metal-dependent hydrolase (beta-lactamase superfamily II)